MKTALIFLAVAILVLLLFYSGVDIWFTKTTIDIRFHDTYFVISHPHIFLVLLLYLGTFFFLGGIIGTRFRNKIFLTLFIVILAADIIIIWKVYSMFHH